MRALPRRTAAVVVASLVGGTLALTGPLVTPAAAAVVSPLVAAYNQDVYGDFLLTGNGSMRCPLAPDSPSAPNTGAGSCESGTSRASAAVNDSFDMQWNDLDGAGANFSGSSGTVTVPIGSTVAFARLYWSGNTGSLAGDGRAVSCGARQDAVGVDADAPAANATTGVTTDPATSAVRLTAAGATLNYVPGASFVKDTGAIPGSAAEYYSAYADVTAQLAALPRGSAQTLTVSNVWAPEGFNCYAGWSLALVYSYPSAHPNALLKKSVQVFNGHVRQFSGEAATTTTVTGLRSTTTNARVGVTAYEGDVGITGDSLSVNGVPQAEPLGAGSSNFFTGDAQGAAQPDVANNYSVDSKVFTTSSIPSGSTSATLSIATAGDSYLLQNFLIATPIPDIRATKDVSATTVRAGSPITFTFTISNPTDAPLDNVRVTDAQFPVCSRSNLGTVPAQQSLTYTCVATAPAGGFTNTAVIAGDDRFPSTPPVTTSPSSPPVTVINPGIALTKTANAASYSAGDTITFTITARNTGDAPLSAVSVTDPSAAGCARTLGALAPGATSTYTCTATAPFTGGSNTANVVGTDTSNAPVTATATAPVPTNGSISGRVFADVANNGAVDAADSGLSGVILTLSGTTTAGATINRTTTSNASGSWTFTAVPPGTYTVTEAQPSATAYADGTDTPGTRATAAGNDAVTVTLPDNGTSTGTLFAEVPRGSVGGAVYEDVNANGTRQAGEPGIGGVTVTLTGSDDGGNPVNRTATTAADGTYSFAGVRAGTYTVTEPSQPSGYVDGRDAIGTVNGTGAGTLSPPDAVAAITLPAGGTGAGYVFGEVRVATLTGNVQLDGTATTTPVTVTLTGTDDLGAAVSTSTQTGVGGAFVFTNLRPGTYTVTETQPAAYGAGTATAGTAGGTAGNANTISGITLASGVNASGYVFDDTSASWSGTVFEDLDRDGLRTAGETGAFPGAGLTVTLTGGTGGPRSTTTAADGTYSFAGLPAGTYTAAFAAPAGTRLTTPTSLTTAVAAGTASPAHDFGVRRLRPPVAVADAVPTAFETPVAVPVVGNDSDPDGDALTITGSTAPANGSVSCSSAACTYTPAAGFSGTDAFAYTITDVTGQTATATVTVTVAPRPNRAPDAVDDARSTLLGTPVAVPVLTNDAEPDDDPLTVTLHGQGANGTVTQDGDVLTYTPAAGFTGTDAFTYTISDGRGLTDTATVTVTVRPAGTVTGTVFADADGDGAAQAGDTGIGGVSVTLSGQPDQVGVPALSRTTTTAADGTFAFAGVPAGSYTLTEDQPTGFVTSVNTAGTDAVVGPGPDSISVTLADGGASTDNRFGERPQASLSGATYDDTDGSGSRQAGEPGTAGVTVTLTGTDEDGNAVSRTAVTAADGTYAFSDLRAGTYAVTQTQPVGYLDRAETAGAAGGTLTAPDAITAIALTRTVEATGYLFGDVRPASLSGAVTRDGAASPAPVTVTLTGTDDLGAPVSVATTSGANGAYAFVGLRPGTYVVTETQPSGLGAGSSSLGTAGGTRAGANQVGAIALASGTAATGYDFDNTSAVLSGTVFRDANGDGGLDAGEAGLGPDPVVVTATGPSGTLTTQTAADGTYSFAGLLSGSYDVGIVPPPGTSLTSVSPVPAVVPAGGSSSDNNFGVRPETAPDAVDDDAVTPFDAPLPLAVLGNDADPDGDPLSVSAFDVTTTRGGTVSRDDDVLTYTPAPGFFGTDTFTYAVSDGRGGSDTATVTVVVRPPGSVSGSVFADANGDGAADPGDTGVLGVSITLSGTPDGTTTPISLTTLTAADGTWSFADVPAGTYTVTESQPSGFVTSSNTPGSGAVLGAAPDSFVVELADNGTSVNNAFGERPQASIAGVVYHDSNANGSRQGGEPGLGGVTVELTGTDEAGNAVARTAVTVGGGTFAFAGLRAGTYALTQTQPAGYLDGREVAGGAGGTLTGPDAITAISLGRTTATSGYLFGEVLAASVSGTVTLDGVANPDAVTVTLTGVDDLGAPVSTTTTTSAGGFALTGLRPGSYTVTAAQPAGLGDGSATPGTAGGTPSGTDAVTGIVLASGTAATGYVLDDTTASLSGTVFLDADGNGTQDGSERGFGPGPLDVTVTGPGGVSAVQTDADGAFSVGGLPAGSYTVTLAAPGGTSATTPDPLTVLVPAGGSADAPFGLRLERPPVAVDDAVTAAYNTPVPVPALVNDLDPDGDPLTITSFDPVATQGGTVTGSGGVLTYTPAPGFSGTDTFTYAISDSRGGAGTATVTVTVRAPGTVSGVVYADRNGNGLREPGDTGISGVGVTIAGTPDGGGPAVEQTVLTDPSGSWSFVNVPAGTYTVTEDQPPGYTTSVNTPGTGATLGGLADTLTVVLADDGASVNSLFGEQPQASLSGAVYDDADGDGARSSGEPGLGGVTVTLTGTDDDGNAVTAATTSASDGTWSFTGLRAGSYAVTETQPGGYLDRAETAGSAGGALTGPDSITLVPLGATTSATGYLFGNVQAASLAGTVTRDGTATPTAVTVTLTGTDDLGAAVSLSTTTGAGGGYAFSDLRPGTYDVTETQPAGLGAGTAAVGDVGGSPAGPDAVTGIVLGSGERATGYDFDDTTASLSGTVFADRADYDGVLNGAETGYGAGLTVTLDGPGGPRTTTTLADGSYSFGSLLAGTYAVSVPAPTGTSITSGSPLTVVVTAGTPSTGNDVGLRPETAPDAENDAPVSAFNTPVAIPVLLNDTPDADGDPVTLVSFDPTTASGGSVTSSGGVLTYTPAPGFFGTDTFTYTVTDGRGGFDTATVAVTVRAPGTVSGTVFSDTDGDGLVTVDDDGGIVGVVITLTGQPDGGGAPITRTTTTAADGSFAFSGIPAGAYSLTESQPAGFVTSSNTAGSNASPTGTDGFAVVLGDAGSSVGTLFGERPQALLAGRVFDDANADGDLQAGTEAGIGGVTITLTGTDETGAPVLRTTVTDADGAWAFADLRAGSYDVTEAQPATYLDGRETVGTAAGLLVGPDSVTGISLTRTTAGTGYQFAEVGAASLAGTVSRDGDPTPVAVQVTLTGTDDLGSPVSATTSTTGGAFSFDGLRPGSYVLTETQPAGLGAGTATAGSAGGTPVGANQVTGILLGSGTVASGYAFDDTTGTVSGTVYEDLDRSGTLSGSETALPGGPLTVVLDGPGGQVTTTTGPDGTYEVPGLADGTYTVTLVVPAGASLTSASPLTVVLPAGQPSAGNDIGLRRERPPVAVDDGTNPTAYDTPVAVTVLGNDSDPDGDDVRVSAFDATSARGGTVTAVGDVLTYTPAPGTTGSDAFAYTITDDRGGFSTATVTVQIGAQPLPPVFGPGPDNDAQTVPVGSVPAPLSATDPEGGPLTYAVTTGTLPAGLVLLPDGTFDPASPATGPGAATVTVTVTDAQGLTDTTELVVTVPNRPPAYDASPLNDAQTVPLDSTPSPLTATDPDGDPLTYGPATGLPDGVTLAGDGTFSGSPTTPGTYSVTVPVTDGEGGTDTTTLVITVPPAPNQPPAYAPDATNTAQTVPVGQPLAPLTATDPEDQPLVYGPATGLPAGVTLNGDGTFSGSPTTPGTYSVTVPVTDPGGLTATTTLVVTVPNREPVFAPSPLNDAQTVPLGATPAPVTATDPDGDPLTYGPTTGLPTGVTLNGDGTFSGSPTTPGTYPVTIPVSDGKGGDDTTTLVITVPPPANQPPAYTGAAGNTAQTVVLGDPVTALAATDPEGGPLDHAVLTGELPPGVTLADDGTFSGSPTTPGTYVVTVAVTDAGGLTDTTELTITVPAPVNQPPAYTGAAGNTAQTVPLGSTPAPLGATDPEGQPLTHVASDPADLPPGVTLNPNGTFSGAPLEAGTYPVTVVVSDGSGGTDSTRLVITVPAPPVNQPPAFTPASTNTAQTVPIGAPLTPLAATDPEGRTLTYAFTDGDLPPGVALDDDGTLDGAPTTPGTYTATITVTDPQGLSDTTTLVVTVPAPAVNPPPAFTPAPTNDAQTVPVGGPVTPLAATDPNHTADQLTYTQTDGELPPGVTLDDDGTLDGAPTVPGTYTATVVVTDPLGASATTTLVLTVPAPPVNAPPSFTPATSNDAQTVPVGGPVTPLAATDPDDAPAELTYTQTGGDLPPGVTLDEDGTLDGAPTTPGTYTSTVVVTDPSGASDTTTLVLTVPAPPNTAPVAVDDERTTTAGTTVTVPVAGNDTDVDGDDLTVQGFTQPAAGGTVTQPTPGGSLVFTPPAGGTGEFAFTYVVSDGEGGTDTGTVVVTVVAPPPSNLPPAFTGAGSNTAQQVPVGGPVTDLAATDPEGQPLTYVQTGGDLPPGVTLDADGAFAGTPTTPGTYAVTVDVLDPFGLAGTTTLTITVPVPPADRPPVAAADAASTPFGTAVTIPVLANDTDADGDDLTVVSVTQPSGGTVALRPDGSVVLLPAPGFSGQTTFEYVVADGNGRSDSAVVTVTVAPPPPVNQPPVAVDDVVTTSQGQGVALDVVVNDTDPEGDDLAVVAVTQPAHGTVSCTAAGVCSYLPAAGFSGTDSFDYTVSDGSGNSDGAMVTVTVSPTPPPVNAAPVAVDDSATTPSGTTVRIPVLTNDSDPEADPLTISSLTQGADGGVTLNPADGTISYLPAPGFAGTDTFTYTVTDNQGNTDTATVTVTVAPAPVNRPPVGTDDSATTPVSSAVTIPVLPNDTDPDGDPLVVLSSTLPSSGTLSVQGGVFTYVPDRGFVGTDSFTYTISDGRGGTDVVTVIVTITPPANTTPVTTPDTVATPAGQPIPIPVLDNDEDPDGDALEIISVTQPQNGTVSLEDGLPVYTPADGFTGTDTFTYTVTDGNGGTQTETVTVTVTGSGSGDGGDGDNGGPGGGGTGDGSGDGSGSGGRIPFTGSESQVLLSWGLLALLLGAALTAAGARRRHQRHG